MDLHLLGEQLTNSVDLPPLVDAELEKRPSPQERPPTAMPSVALATRALIALDLRRGRLLSLPEDPLLLPARLILAIFRYFWDGEEDHEADSQQVLLWVLLAVRLVHPACDRMVVCAVTPHKSFPLDFLFSPASCTRWGRQCCNRPVLWSVGPSL